MVSEGAEPLSICHFEVDHLFPRSKGGRTVLQVRTTTQNMATVCICLLRPSCHTQHGRCAVACLPGASWCPAGLGQSQLALQASTHSDLQSPTMCLLCCPLHATQNVAAVQWHACRVRAGALLASVTISPEGINPLSCGLSDSMLQVRLPQG